MAWEDLNPLDNNYKFIVKNFKQTIAIQYNKDINRWRVIAHDNFVVVSPNVKIFDTPFGKSLSTTPKRLRRSVSNHQNLINFNDKFNNDYIKIGFEANNTTQQQNQPSILELGDSWLNSIDINSNLTLAYAFIKKWTNEKFNFNSTQYDIEMTPVECEIFASNAVQDFNENLMKISLSCGIPTVMRDITSEIDLSKIIFTVKNKCEKNSIDKIGDLLVRELIVKNKWKIIAKSSEKQYIKLKTKIDQYVFKFTNDIMRVDDERWTRVMTKP